jgi:hypothetical protein
VDDGRILTAGADANRKMQWLGAFANKHFSGDELKEIKEILAALNQARQARNFILHASWATHIPSGDAVGASVKEKSDDPTLIVVERFSESKMQNICELIDAVKWVLMEWREKHEASREKSP